MHPTSIAFGEVHGSHGGGDTVELVMVGLGRMGANMAARLVAGGHRVVGVDLDPAAVEAAKELGAEGAASLEEALSMVSSPRRVWVMVPAGDPVDATIAALHPLLEAGDVVIDGGNSWYRDTVRRSEVVAEDGIEYVDVGTSGGIWGRTEGYSMMVGGPERVVAELRPLFEVLAPAADRGWGRVGPTGSGHFVKMVHNGIEYGLMEAYAEGFAILEAKDEFRLDLHGVAEIWRYGSVVRSWLLDLAARALAEEPDLASIAPYVADSGEGRWTVTEAIDLNVSAPIIALSLLERIESRDQVSFADRMLAAMRHGFGGHPVKAAG
jgi:6-phosphogluconate dehydrogenase